MEKSAIAERHWLRTQRQMLKEIEIQKIDKMDRKARANK